jgi:hypothetical protein
MGWRTNRYGPTSERRTRGRPRERRERRPERDRAGGRQRQPGDPDQPTDRREDQASLLRPGRPDHAEHGGDGEQQELRDDPSLASAFERDDRPLLSQDRIMSRSGRSGIEVRIVTAWGMHAA